MAELHCTGGSKLLIIHWATHLGPVHPDALSSHSSISPPLSPSLSLSPSLFLSLGLSFRVWCPRGVWNPVPTRRGSPHLLLLLLQRRRGPCRTRAGFGRAPVWGWWCRAGRAAARTWCAAGVAVCTGSRAWPSGPASLCTAPDAPTSSSWAVPGARTGAWRGARRTPRTGTDTQTGTNRHRHTHTHKHKPTNRHRHRHTDTDTHTGTNTDWFNKQRSDKPSSDNGVQTFKRSVMISSVGQTVTVRNLSYSGLKSVFLTCPMLKAQAPEEVSLCRLWRNENMLGVTQKWQLANGVRMLGGVTSSFMSLSVVIWSVRCVCRVNLCPYNWPRKRPGPELVPNEVLSGWEEEQQGGSVQFA